jgi:hypothetical protein
MDSPPPQNGLSNMKFLTGNKMKRECGRLPPLISSFPAVNDVLPQNRPVSEKQAVSGNTSFPSNPNTLSYNHVT